MGWFSELFSPTKRAGQKSSVVSCPCSMPYVILDVETTGLNPASDKIIQLSAIKYSTNGTPVESYNTYLNPERDIPPRITQITGIEDSTIQSAPTADQVQTTFLSFLENNLLVGYNVTFDLRFLCAEFGASLNGRKYVDVLPIVRNYLCCSDYKLATVAEECGFSPKTGFHDSFGDCEAVAAILASLDVPLEKFFQTFSASPPVSKAYEEASLAHPRVSQKDITPRTDHIDPQHPLYQKSIVFTGTLRISRFEAAQLAADVGAIIRSSVSSKTDFLIVGQQDVNLVGDDGMSSKEEKAFALNQAGKAHIKMICESEFLHMVRREELI